ncbi:MAG: cupin domain-containing protein [Candidatus Omnitrophica bacterium]|nr:cupin domain-containing protein [Candidatus Omnitrophota bacterium]
MAEVRRIADIVEYQKGSVVSSTLLKKQTGTVTVFAFDQGQGLSEHEAPFDALVQIVEGEAEIRIGGEPKLLKQGDSIVMPANVPHALNAPVPFKMLLTLIKSGDD